MRLSQQVGKSSLKGAYWFVREHLKLGATQKVAAYGKRSFKHHIKFNICGDYGGGATPVPIPNTEVKSSSADGTWV